MNDAVELATFHLLAGEINDALVALDARLENAPEDDAARRLRAEIYTTRNTPETLADALADLARLDERTPEDGLHIALIFERMGDLPRAIQTLAETSAAAPEHLRVRQRWMELAFKSGDLETARLAVRGLPDDWRMLELAGDLTARYAEATGEDDDLLTQADALYEMALQSLPSGHWNSPFRARILLARASVNLRLNLPDEVAHYAELAGALIPTEPAYHFYIGWSLVKRGSGAQGFARVQRALKAASEPVYEALWETIAGDEDFQNLSLH